MTITELMTKHGITATDPQSMTAFLQDVRAHDLMPEYTIEELADEIVNETLADVISYATSGDNINERGRKLMSAIIERLGQEEATFNMWRVKI